MLHCSAKLLHHLRQCPCYQLFVSYYYDIITIPLVGLRGVIGAIDNVQSFVVFLYGFPKLYCVFALLFVYSPPLNFCNKSGGCRFDIQLCLSNSTYIVRSLYNTPLIDDTLFSLSYQQTLNKLNGSDRRTDNPKYWEGAPLTYFGKCQSRNVVPVLEFQWGEDKFWTNFKWKNSNSFLHRILIPLIFRVTTDKNSTN